MSANVYFLKGTQIGIGSLSGETVSTIVTILAVRYWGVQYADDYTSDLSEESGINGDYDRAILAGVLRNFAEDDENFKAAAYWRSVYDELRRAAKREANTRKDGTPYGVTAEGY